LSLHTHIQAGQRQPHYCHYTHTLIFLLLWIPPLSAKSGFIRRPARGTENKKAFSPRITANEGIQPWRDPNRGRELVSSFSLRRSRPPLWRPDEHNRTGILTPDFQPRSRLPATIAVASGACHPLQWRNRPRFPRGSLSSDCVYRLELPEQSKPPIQRAAACLFHLHHYFKKNLKSARENFGAVRRFNAELAQRFQGDMRANLIRRI